MNEDTDAKLKSVTIEADPDTDHDRDYACIGVRASATVVVNSTIQTLKTPGLWEIAAESDRGYLSSVAEEELRELTAILDELGIERRPVVTATWDDDAPVSGGVDTE